MKKASITYTKNNLSRLLGMVREGETVLVMDRRTPIARIDPVCPSALSREDRLRPLVESGMVTVPLRPLNAARFLEAEKGKAGKGASAVVALLKDREESQ